MPSVYGLWRGVVVDNADPEQRQRLVVTVPAVLGGSATGWALACLSPGATTTPPDPGTGVWVMFEGGDPAHPVWIGTW